MVRLDRRAVVLGAVIAGGLAVPPILVYQALYTTDVIGDESSLALVFYAMAMGGFATGGFVAGSKRPDSPLTHGAAAGFLAFAVVQLVASSVALARGDGVSLVKIVFNAMLATALGLVGALVAARRSTVPQQP